MSKLAKSLVIATTAATLLALATAAASATRLEIPNANRGFRIVWHPLEIQLSGAAPATIRCNVTLEGTFHRTTYTKTSGSLIGYVTRAPAINESRCTGGTARILSETLPWHVRYDSFTGTLPTIATIRLQIIGFSLSWTPNGSTQCLLRTEAGRPLLGDANVTAEGGGGRQIASLTLLPTAEIPLSGLFCEFNRSHLAGTGTVTVLGETATPKVRLI